jgi:hypothetical protein
MRGNGVISLLVVVTVCCLELTAQSLVYSDRGNRLEGYVRREIAAPAFEALGFIRGPQLKTFRSPAVLNLHFFLSRSSRVRIHALELIPLKQYQMEVKRADWREGWNNFGPWPSSDVLDPLGVSLANIAVLAQGDETQSEAELVPVSFVSPEAIPSDYEFQFRVKYDLETASFRVERIDSGEVLRSGVLRRVPGEAPASLHFDLANVSAGKYRLAIDCLYQGRGGGPQRVFTFYHAPQALRAR